MNEQKNDHSLWLIESYVILIISWKEISRKEINQLYFALQKKSQNLKKDKFYLNLLFLWWSYALTVATNSLSLLPLRGAGSVTEQLTEGSSNAVPALGLSLGGLEAAVSKFGKPLWRGWKEEKPWEFLERKRWPATTELQVNLQMAPAIRLQLRKRFPQARSEESPSWAQSTTELCKLIKCLFL